MITAQEIAEGLEKGRRVGDGYIACCPAHDDTDPSLSIKDGYTGKPVVHCQSGCEQEDVIAALKEKWLWYDTPATALSARRRRDKPKAQIKPASPLTALQRGCIERYWIGSEEWFNDGPKVEEHPYAIRKGITHACGARRIIADYPFGRPTDCIVLPQRSSGDYYLTGVQLINEAGEKRNIGRHGYMFLGCWEHPRAVIHIVEGWATAWAVLEDYPGPCGCIVAFGKNHMKAAAEIATSQFRRLEITWTESDKYDYLDFRTYWPDLAAMQMRHAMTAGLAHG